MNKIYNALNKLYGILMTVSFFGGIAPLIPYCVALIIGGTTGEAIALFLYKQFYPWVIACGSIAVLVGLINTYVKKLIDVKDKKAEQ